MKRGVKHSSKAGKVKSSKTSGSIRIISGQFKGRKLAVLDVQGLRPTTDKNKEMLFNWLIPYTADARCLDAFAGSGGLGFEALSRYAQHCTFIELDRKAATKLEDNAELLSLTQEQFKLHKGEALSALGKETQAFDLIFLDPPFHKELLPDVIDVIQRKQLLTATGVIYIECEGHGTAYAVPDNWQLIKEKHSAQILARLYKVNP